MSLDPVTAILDIGGKVIERLWPDPAQRDAAKLELFKATQAGEMAEATHVFELTKAQILTNLEEAKSVNWFVAGARPFVMWVCGFSFAYVALLEPVLRFAAQVIFDYAGEFPVIDTNLTMQVLLGILGLGAYRTFEKTKNVEDNR